MIEVTFDVGSLPQSRLKELVIPVIYERPNPGTMSNSNLNELDLLLGLPKPVEEMTDKELEKFLLKHFPHTRPTGTDLASLLNDPLLKGVDVQAIINQTQNFKFKK
jgi:hypothetical protein